LILKNRQKHTKKWLEEGQHMKISRLKDRERDHCCRCVVHVWPLCHSPCCIWIWWQPVGTEISALTSPGLSTNSLYQLWKHSNEHT